MKEKSRKNILSCHSCSVDKGNEKSKFRQVTANICPGHIGLFVTAVAILIMQII